MITKKGVIKSCWCWTIFFSLFSTFQSLLGCNQEGYLKIRVFIHGECHKQLVEGFSWLCVKDSESFRFLCIRLRGHNLTLFPKINNVLPFFHHKLLGWSCWLWLFAFRSFYRIKEHTSYILDKSESQEFIKYFLDNIIYACVLAKKTHLSAHNSRARA